MMNTSVPPGWVGKTRHKTCQKSRRDRALPRRCDCQSMPNDPASPMQRYRVWPGGMSEEEQHVVLDNSLIIYSHRIMYNHAAGPSCHRFLVD